MMLLVLWYVVVFLIGIVVGSFLNVCVGRLPFEKSLIWPGSRCESCRQPVRWFDNVPVVSYLVLRGRCRTCGAKIPLRLPLVEWGTGLAFVAMFHLEMVANVLDLPVIRQNWGLAPGMVPLEATVVFAHHAILLSFLLAASLCDLADMEIPMSITFWGLFVGLVLSALLPWPVPESSALPRPPALGGLIPTIPTGAYAWPVWHPLPAWLPAGSWRLGLATGLAGALAGMLVLRAVRFLFMLGRGIEGMGVGDADLMMMAGAFVGWQPIILAFFVSVFPGLIFAIVKFVITRRQDLPFGPSLALGVLLTVFAWPRIGPLFQSMFFDPIFLGLLIVAGAVALLATSFLLRLLAFRVPADED
jgi:leader peptidase (prepilin peptidase) / N-methyltransferase